MCHQYGSRIYTFDDVKLPSFGGIHEHNVRAKPHNQIPGEQGLRLTYKVVNEVFALAFTNRTKRSFASVSCVSVMQVGCMYLGDERADLHAEPVRTGVHICCCTMLDALGLWSGVSPPLAFPDSP